MAVLVVLVGVHAFDVIAEAEHWPFSPYPMYSKLNTSRDFSTVNLVGVATGQGNTREVPLKGAWLRTSLNYLSTSKKRESPAKLRRALADILKFTDDRRAKGFHQLPKFKAIRLYRETWHMSADADPIGPPDRRDLIASYTRGQGEATTQSTTN